MATNEIHPIQGGILRVLLFKPRAKFSELNTYSASSDHFTFHVKRLVELGLIEKTENDLYDLTTEGKEFANRMDTEAEKMIIEKQAKLGVLIVGVRKTEDGEEYLMQQRLKQPFYGFYGAVTGKIKWGESVRETAKREFKEETGLTAKLVFTGIEHKMDYSKGGALLEDKYFYVFRAEDVEGDLIEKFEGGENKWCLKNKIKNLPNLFDDVMEIHEMIETDEVEFIENTYTVSGF